MSKLMNCGGCYDQPNERQAESYCEPIRVTENQKEFLHQLGHCRYLPVTRFTVKDSREDDYATTALAPVFIRSVADDMASVKEAGAYLQRLENMGLITLDYDIPLNGYEYEEYRESALFKYFCATVAEGASKPGFWGDTPLLELGSMTLTCGGEKIAAAYCGHKHHPS